MLLIRGSCTGKKKDIEKTKKKPRESLEDGE